VLPVAIGRRQPDDRTMSKHTLIATLNRLAVLIPGPPMVRACAALLRSFRA
jgi:hypothetical protein